MLAFSIPLVALLIPIVAIVGGIAAGIFRMRAQQKIAELAMQERIVAIEKGLDPATLPPPPSMADADEREELGLDPRTRAERTAQGLLVGGIITLFAGFGVALVLWLLPQTAALGLGVIGVVPVFVGLGLMVASWVVKPKGPARLPAQPSTSP
ncbi:MAG: hypothetical protein QM767_27935 [Anaeromyxobacter sp.]